MSPSDGKTSVESDIAYDFLYNLTKEDLIRRHIKELKKSIQKPENTAVAEVMAVSNETTTTIENKNTSTKQLGGGPSQLCFQQFSFSIFGNSGCSIAGGGTATSGGSGSGGVIKTIARKFFGRKTFFTRG